MNFFLLLFVVATAVCGEAAKANPRGNSKVDLAELKAEPTERRVRMKRVLAKLREKAKRQNIGLNGPNVVDLEQAVDKRRDASSHPGQYVRRDFLKVLLLLFGRRATRESRAPHPCMVGHTPPT